MVARPVEIIIDRLDITGPAAPAERDIARALGRAMSAHGLSEPVRRAVTSETASAVHQAVRPHTNHPGGTR